MTPADADRVFGLGRLKMVTGQHVEVYREEALPGERRRYTKRFLSTMEGDFREWTEREWRILARLVGHGVACVPEVVQFDRGAGGGTALVQTYDAGVTVDQWATLLPVERDGRVLAHVFDDCAHWWALAKHGLQALDAIHRLEVIHLDIKADNVCIPYGPPHFRPESPGARLQPLFDRLALIDFAFSLVAGEALATPLPIGRQQDYEYQSPRLLEALDAGRRGDLEPTRRLDWRCDLYSWAAMLARYLPADLRLGCGWTAARHAAAHALIARIRECHDREPAAERPHEELIAIAGEPLAGRELAESLEREWTLASHAAPAAAVVAPTPVTRIAPAVRAPAAPAAPITPVFDDASVAAADRVDEPAFAPIEAPAVAAAEPMLVSSVEPVQAATEPPAAPVLPAVDAKAPPAEGPRASVRKKRLAVGIRKFAIPGAIAGLVASIVLLSAGGAWTALRKLVAPAPPSRQVAQQPPKPRPATEREPAPAEPVASDFSERSLQLLAGPIPELAARAERSLASALSLAELAEREADDAAVRQAIEAAPRPALDSRFARSRAPDDARRLNDQARTAFWTRRAVREAFDLQMRAFGANPLDPEIAGNLAYFHLKIHPPQPEMARQLALHALAMRGPNSPAGRWEDWTTLAVGSAMTGRDADARRAFWLTLSLTDNVEKNCRAALNAAASYGERVRPPAEALLARVNARGASGTSPYCAWPPDWGAGTRFP